MSEFANQSDRPERHLPDDDAMDRLLAMSLPNRPEPRPTVGLAAIAMDRARVAERVAEAQRARLRAQRWRVRVATAVAVMMLVLLLAFGVRRAIVQYASIETLGTQQETTTTSSDSNTSTETSSAVRIGIGLLIAALAGLAAERALSTERPVPDPGQLLKSV